MTNTWRNDLRYGLRVIAKSRGFTTAAVLSLAIGIGASTAIFSATNALILRPLPYADADRLAILWQRSPGLNVPRDWFSLGQYLDIAADNTTFERVAAAIGASFNLTGDGRPERVDGVRVSSSFFPVFGIRAAIGGVFSADDDQPGKSEGVILTDGFWRRRFGADRAIVGKTMTLNGTPRTVVGVLPPSFSLDKEVMPAVNGIQRAEFLLPLRVPPTARAKRDGEDFNVFAKLRSGVSVERAQAEMDGLAARMKQQYPANYPPNGGLTISVLPLVDQVVGDVRLALYILLGAVSLLLFIACGNVANLLLSRAAARETELAIRAAVGAARARLIQQLVTESLLLALFGGAIGLIGAFAGVQSLRLFGSANIPRAAEIAVDGRVLAFALAVSVATTVLFGLLPALRASRVDPATALKEGGRSSLDTTARRGEVRRLMVAGQISLSLVLLIGAALLTRSYARIAAANPGFDPRHTLSFRVSVPGYRYNKPELVSGFYDQLDRRLRALPGVAHVGTNYQLPLSSVALAWEPIGIEGYVPTAAAGNLIISSSAYVSPDYFNAMGMPLLAGRLFTPQDNKQSPPVVIVDDKLAARFWPGESALGKRLRQGADGPWRAVVGVVADTREYEVDAEPPITAFFPVEQYNIASRYVVVRASPTMDASSLTAAVRRELLAIDPDLPLYDVSTMEQRLGDSLARRRLTMALMIGFACISLVLAAIGIYGVISYWVGSRTRDIGIRIALGADRASIVRLIAREFGVVIGAGIVAGLVAAFGLTRLMASMLFGVSATDVFTFAAIPLVLGVVALVATLVPARRAARVDPLAAMR